MKKETGCKIWNFRLGVCKDQSHETLLQVDGYILQTYWVFIHFSAFIWFVFPFHTWISSKNQIKFIICYHNTELYWIICYYNTVVLSYSLSIWSFKFKSLSIYEWYFNFCLCCTSFIGSSKRSEQKKDEFKCEWVFFWSVFSRNRTEYGEIRSAESPNAG